MKKIFIILFPVILITLFMSCNKTKSYSELQDEEIATINNYIQQNNIQIVTTKPAENAWGTNVYYKTTSGLYFHLVNVGDKTDSLTINSEVGYRFIEYALDAANTVRLKNWEPWDFPDPILFTYGNTNSITTLGSGIYEAMGLIK